MLETVYNLFQSSMFTTMLTTKQNSTFFLPLGNLLMCNRKQESEQNLERTQSKLFFERSFEEKVLCNRTYPYPFLG